MQTVTAADGTVHNFPDEASPDMIAGALGVTHEGPPSVPVDMAASVVASGLPRGIAETAMLPVSVPRMLDEWVVQPTVGRAAKAMVNGTDSLVRHIMGKPQLTPEESEAINARVDKARKDNPNPLYAVQDLVRKVMDDNLYKPKTTAGKYSGTIAEFAVPGGIFGKGKMAERAVADVLAPALASETGGQMFEGTALEGPARFIAALLGTGGAAAVRARAAAPETAVRDATKGVTPAQFDEAKALQANQHGINLTGPQAIDQVTGGNTKLGDVQRVVEGTTRGGGKMQPFFAEVPGQVNTAVTTQLDNIAPQSANPSELGPRASSVAESVVRDSLAATPEGKALSDAIFGTGPRTTAAQAGETIQPVVGEVYARREGMRNATGNADYNAARAAKPDVPVTADDTLKIIDDMGKTAKGSVADALGKVRDMLIMPGKKVISDNVDEQAFEAVFGGGKPTPRAAENRVEGLINASENIDSMITAAKQAGDGAVVKSLEDVKNSLTKTLEAVPEYRAARENFQAASKPLAPFEQPNAPAMGKVVEQDQFGKGYIMPPEKVAPTIEAGGPTTAKAFKEAAPPQATEAFGNYLSTKIMEGATDASGNVNLEKLQIALRDNADLLNEYPAVRDNLARVGKAEGDMAAPRAKAAETPEGKIAASKTTEGAYGEVLSKSPLAGSEKEVANAMKRIGEKDPELAAALVRQGLADSFDASTKKLTGGDNYYGGARYAKEVAGSAQQEKNLMEVLANTPGTRDPATFGDLIEVLRATGRRKPLGSATAFNAETIKDLGSGSMMSRAANVAKTAGTSIITNASDMSKRAWLGRNVESLAEMFMSPQSVEEIRRIAAKAAQPVKEPAVRVGVANAPATTRERKKGTK